MADNLNDILIAQFKKAFALSDFGTSFVQEVFYVGYFTLTIPVSLVMRRFGYKAAIVAGLCLYGCGALLFYPAAQAWVYQILPLALFVIAAGLAFSETWANPLGAISGILIGHTFILSGTEHDARALATMDVAAREAFYRSEVQAVATFGITNGAKEGFAA